MRAVSQIEECQNRESVEGDTFSYFRRLKLKDMARRMRGRRPRGLYHPRTYLAARWPWTLPKAAPRSHRLFDGLGNGIVIEPGPAFARYLRLTQVTIRPLCSHDQGLRRQGN